MILVEGTIAVLSKTSFFVSGLSQLSFSLRVPVTNLTGGVSLGFLSFSFCHQGFHFTASLEI